LTSGRVFATTYDPDAAVWRLWAPLGAACILGMAGLFLNVLPMTFISAFFSMLALRNWPYSEPNRVILRMNDAGVDIDGVGHIPWHNISRAGLITVPIPKFRPRIIRLELNGPLRTQATPVKAFLRPGWQKVLGRSMGPNALMLPINGLYDSPQDIADAFRTFLPDRFIVMLPGSLSE
tara:strand:- start:208 stop:741 length:534 start_codon:yes stop_codon:yes gene_type:complete